MATPYQRVSAVMAENYRKVAQVDDILLLIRLISRQPTGKIIAARVQDDFLVCRLNGWTQ